MAFNYVKSAGYLEEILVGVVKQAELFVGGLLVLSQKIDLLMRNLSISKKAKQQRNNKISIFKTYLHGTNGNL